MKGEHSRNDLSARILLQNISSVNLQYPSHACLFQSLKIWLHKNKWNALCSERKKQVNTQNPSPWFLPSCIPPVTTFITLFTSSYLFFFLSFFGMHPLSVSLFGPKSSSTPYSQTTFLPRSERRSFTPIQNKRQNYASVYLNIYIFG
jgi:hypothetical protein